MKSDQVTWLDVLFFDTVLSKRGSNQGCLVHISYECSAHPNHLKELV